MYLLAQIWPGAQPKARFPSYVEGFTVHGLWPNYADNSWPQFCDNSCGRQAGETAPPSAPLTLPE